MKRTSNHLAAVLSTGMLGLFISAAATAADLTKDEVKAKVEAAGYTDVSGIRREKSHFDAKAKKDGKAVALDIDAKTGAITPETEESEEHEHHKKDKD